MTTRGHAFDYIAGHPGLDFVNTVDWRRDPARRRDLIPSYDALVAWGRGAGLLSAAVAAALSAEARRHPRRALRALHRAVFVREMLYRVFSAAAQGKPASAADVRRLNLALAVALGRRRLAAGGARVEWTWVHRPDDLNRLLWPIVTAAVGLLTADACGAVRSCAADECGWLFLDTSRNHRRRWCTMQGCGNRAKARRFYGRRRAGAAGS